MKSIWDKDIYVKLISALIAIVLWIYVGFQNPETESVFRNIPVTVNLPSSTSNMGNLSVITGASYKVDVTLSGKRNVLKSLKDSDIKATVNAKDIEGPGSYELPVSIECSRSDVLILRKNPDKLKIRLDYILTSQVKVEVKTESKLSTLEYMIDDLNVEPEFISVTGPAAEVSSIKKAVVTSKIDRSDSNILQKLSYVFYDESGNVVNSDYITTDTNEVRVSAKVLKIKSVPLTIDLQNNNNLFEYKIEPTEIKIAGSEDTINGINSIKLGQVDVSNITGNEKMSLNIVMPKNVINLDNTDKALLSFSADNLSTRIIEISNIELLNVHEGYNVEIASIPIEIKVRGRAENVASVSPEDFRVYIDLSKTAVNEGTYEVNVGVEVLNNKEVGIFGQAVAKIKVVKSAA